MTELTIDGKIFISSKRAAEITGYAKDYVGQLCREGRVTAKLVGRAWYVLEPSIMEHRYASEQAKEAAKEPKKGGGAGIRGLSSTWETPTYAAEAPETLPEMPSKPAGESSQGTVAAMQAAWQEWFSMKRVPELEPEHLLADHEEIPEAAARAADDEGVSTPQNAPIGGREAEMPMAHGVAEDRTHEAAYEAAAPIAPAEESVYEDSDAVAIPIERIRSQSRSYAPVRPIERPEPLEAIQTVHYEAEPLAQELAEDYGGGFMAGFVKGVAVVAIVIGLAVGVVGSGVLTPYLRQYGLMGYASYIAGTTEYSK